jgi:RNA polymerase sigma factor (sigma-70 family)
MLPRLISYEMMLEEFGFDVPDQEIFSSPVLIAEKRELYRELNSAVNLLNEQQRAIIRKIFFYEESQAQISALLCVSEAMVSRLKRAALTVLREILS